MSAQEEEPQGEIGPDVTVDAAGNVYTLNLFGRLDPLYDATDVAEADVDFDAIMRSAQRILDDQAADLFRGTLSVVRDAVDGGDIPPAAAPDFVRWLFYDQGIPVITASMLAGGALTGLLLRYEVKKGYKPRSALPKTAPAPLPTPTEGQKSVARQAAKIVNQQVTAPGFDKAQTAAISKAIGTATADVLKVQAATFDEWLAPMVPGQVPANLTDLDRATSTLERQVSDLLAGVRQLGTKATKGELATVQAGLAAVGDEIAKLQSQLDLEAPSALDSHVNAIGDQVTRNTDAIARLVADLPDLATGASVAAIGAEVAHIGKQLALEVPSALDTHLNAVAKVANVAEVAAKDALDCCEAQTANLGNVVSALGGKGLLSALGSLALKAVEGVFIAGLLDTALAIVDLPAVVPTTVIDTEALSGWAISAAAVIESDLSWLGKVPSG